MLAGGGGSRGGGVPSLGRPSPPRVREVTEPPTIAPLGVTGAPGALRASRAPQGPVHTVVPAGEGEGEGAAPTGSCCWGGARTPCVVWLAISSLAAD
eukprot:COSAG01_NODE_1422_length_10360_cov_36.853815_2_plen_97_part_00